MKQFIRCAACMGAGLIHQGKGFQSSRCKYCFGTGKRYEYSGPYAKEERKHDEYIERELQFQQRAQERENQSRWLENRDPVYEK